MKTRLRIVGLLALVLGVLYALDWVFALFTRPSNAAVIAGLVILAVLVLAVPPLFRFVVRKPRDAASLILILMATGWLSACTRIGPGHVGIVVNSMGTDRGVSDYPTTTGLVWYMPGKTSVFEYPTYMQTAVWCKDPGEGKPKNEEFSFNTKDQMVITGDVSLSYQLDPNKVPAFYVKFRSDDLEGFTHGFLHNVARDAFNELAPNYTLEEIYGAKKEEFTAKVRERINGQVKDFGVEIQQFGFVGVMRLPPNVEQAINAKIQATQDAIKVENQIRSAEAEAKKAVAAAEGEAKSRVARAEGEAKANVVLTNSLSPGLLEWRRLAISEKAVEKWDGRQPLVTGGQSVPIIQVPALAVAAETKK